jgi:hypothetical protein
MKELLYILFETFTIYAFIYFLGNIILFPFRLTSNPIQRIFYKKISGILFLILINSILFTTFKTINILLLPLIFWVIISNRKFISSKNIFLELKSEFRHLLIIYLALFIVVGVQLYRLDYFNQEITFLSNWDYGYYMTVSEYLFETGIENVAPWFELFEFSQTGKVGLYHYGDIWLMGFMIGFSKLAPSVVFSYIFLPVCISVSFAGILALHSIILVKNYPIFNILLCFLLVFSVGNIPFLREAFGFHYSVMTTPKVMFFSFLIMVAFSFLLHNRLHLFVLTCCSIPIFHIIYAPVIFTSLFLFSLFYFYKTKENKYLFGMIVPILTTIGIIGFYLLFGNISSFYGGSSKIILVDYFYNFLVTTFRHIILRSLPFHAVLWGLLLIIWKENLVLPFNLKLLLRFVAIMIIITIFYRGLLNYNEESKQIYQVLINPLFTILYVILFSYAIKKFEGKKKLLIYSLIFIQGLSSFYIITNKFHQRGNPVSNEFLSEIKEALENKNPIGVFLKDSEKEENHFRVSTYMFLFATELKTIGKGKWVNSISVPEDLNNFEFPERISDVSSSPFYNFIQQQKRNNTFISYKIAQKNFIQQNDIDFIILENGAVLPQELESMLSKIYVDDISQIRLGIFR